MYYNDIDEDNCPDDYLRVTTCPKFVTFITKASVTEESMVDLDYDKVVKLQQQLGKWLLECKIVVGKDN